MTKTEPCGICDSPDVHVVPARAPRRLGDSGDRYVDKRVCGNRTCPSNTGTMRLGDAV